MEEHRSQQGGHGGNRHGEVHLSQEVHHVSKEREKERRHDEMTKRATMTSTIYCEALLHVQTSPKLSAIGRLRTTPKREPSHERFRFSSNKGLVSQRAPNSSIAHEETTVINRTLPQPHHHAAE